MTYECIVGQCGSDVIDKPNNVTSLDDHFNMVIQNI